MAVTFVSSFYDGPTTEKQRAETWMGPQYGVRGAGDWAVTAVSGSDRTVSIAAGSGFGHGLADTTTTNDTIQLDTIASDSRWDMIAVRRNWQPVNGGPTSFVKINGSSVEALPAVGTADTAWNRRPGIMDDQPLALVRVTAGQTQPSAIIDLRCWSGNNGFLIVHKRSLDYLAVPGTRALLGGVEYRYVPDSTGAFGWDSQSDEYRVWNAVTTFAASPSTNSRTSTVTFPAGLFTVAPVVMCEKQSSTGAKFITYVENVTATGCTVGLYTGDGALTSHDALPVYIRAVQTTPTSAVGTA